MAGPGARCGGAAASDFKRGTLCTILGLLLLLAALLLTAYNLRRDAAAGDAAELVLERLTPDLPRQESLSQPPTGEGKEEAFVPDYVLNPELPTAPADVLILPMTQDLTPAIRLATRLRSAGVRTQLYTEQKKFKAKMNYADKLGVPFVIFLGEDEIAKGVIACKDMTSGEQTTLDFAGTLARVQEGLAERNRGKVIVEK